MLIKAEGVTLVSPLPDTPEEDGRKAGVGNGSHLSGCFAVPVSLNFISDPDEAKERCTENLETRNLIKRR